MTLSGMTLSALELSAKDASPVIATVGEASDLSALAVLGGALPPAAETCLAAAGAVYAETARAEALLREAECLAPDHAAVLIGFYRFYFYKGRLCEALAIAERCLVKACRENHLPADWRDVTADGARFGDYADPLARFFLFTLKGYAYLQMRLRAFEASRAAIDKLLELDPSDKVGARVLRDVLERRGGDGDE